MAVAGFSTFPGSPTTVGSVDYDDTDEPGPFGDSPHARWQSTTDQDHNVSPGKVWKAYHEPQILLEEDRKLRRPVFVDRVLWGNVLGAKLGELISQERVYPRNFVRGGVADRENACCLLPPREVGMCYRAGDWRAIPPKPLQFSDEGREFTKESFGAGGDFVKVFERRYRNGYVARSTEAGGQAGERARRRQQQVETLGDDDSSGYSETGKYNVPPLIPWGDGAPIGEEDSGPEAPGTWCPAAASWPVDMSRHPRPEIGPGAHRFGYDTLDREEFRKMEEGNGTETFFASHVGKRLVALSGGVGTGEKKLRGTAELERCAKAAAVDDDQYLHAAERRKNYPAVSAVRLFEKFFIQNHLAADALNKIEQEVSLSENQQPLVPCSLMLPAASAAGTWETSESGCGADNIGAIGTSLFLGPRSSGGGRSSSCSNADSSDDSQAFGGRGGSGGDGRRHAGSVAGSVSSLGSRSSIYGGGSAGGADEEDNISSSMPSINSGRFSSTGFLSRTPSASRTKARARRRRQSMLLPATTAAVRFPSFATATTTTATAIAAAAAAGNSTRALVYPTTSPYDNPTARFAESPASSAAGPCSAHGDASVRPSAMVGGGGGQGSGYTKLSTLERARRRFSSIPGEKKKHKKSTSVSDALDSHAIGSDDGDATGGSGEFTTIARTEANYSVAPAAVAGVGAVEPSADSESSAETGAGLTGTGGGGGGGELPRLGPAGPTRGLGAAAANVSRPLLRKERRRRSLTGGGGGGSSGSVDRFGVVATRKIDLGNADNQERMTGNIRTALLIGACEWCDLDALDRLLELGASPLDCFAGKGSRCVFSQMFIFLLQMDAGLRSRLVRDASLNDLVIERLVAHGQQQRDQTIALCPPPPLAQSLSPSAAVEAAAAASSFLRNPRLTDEGYDERGFGLLHHAAAFGNVRKTEFLLQRGADPDARVGTTLETPLMVAARRGQRDHIRVAAVLLQAGCDLSATDAQRWTALHYAAGVGRKHMCHYLLLVGASREAKDEAGNRPYDLCRHAHPRAYAALCSFRGQDLSSAHLLRYMEKVEVQGMDPAAAHAQLAHLCITTTINNDDNNNNNDNNNDSNTGNETSVASPTDSTMAVAVAASAACAMALGDGCGSGGDDDTASLSSWDAMSLGGWSGSVLSLGSLDEASQGSTCPSSALRDRGSSLGGRSIMVTGRICASKEPSRRPWLERKRRKRRRRAVPGVGGKRAE